MTKYLGQKDGNDEFAFVCPGCGAEGTLGVPRRLGMQPFGCPEGCGSTFVRWSPGLIPILKCVVQRMTEPDSSLRSE